MQDELQKLRKKLATEESNFKKLEGTLLRPMVSLGLVKALIAVVEAQGKEIEALKKASKTD